MARLSLLLFCLLVAGSTVLAKRRRPRTTTIGSPVEPIASADEETSGESTTVSPSTASPADDGKFFPPNKHVPLSKEEIKKHPRWKQGKRTRGVLPASFDARVQWKSCASISLIRNQGACGDCWAVAAESVLSDRLCISSGQKTQVNISANQAAGCSIPGNTPSQNCNNGGDPSYVYKKITFDGLVTGGGYGSGVGCVPYGPSPYTAPDIACSTTCTNPNYKTAFASDNHIIDTYYVKYHNGDMTAADKTQAVEDIKTDLVANGPLTATMTVYSDFQRWGPSQGAYKGPASGAAQMGGHVVRIIGWNKDSNGVEYWMISNSWGAGVGDQGIFWIQTGNNVVGIEARISAPIVKLVDTCSTVWLNSATVAIDQAIAMNYSDPNGSIYLFQGDCTQQFRVKGNKLAAVGKPSNTALTFQNAPPAPIVMYMYSGNQFILINPTGQAGFCPLANGAKKNSCSGGTASQAAPGAYAVASYIDPPTKAAGQWTFMGTQYMDYIFDTSYNGVYIGSLISDSFSMVTTMVNLDGKSMMVFGKNTKGTGALSGILSYPVGGTGFAWKVKPGAMTGTLTCTPAA